MSEIIGIIVAMIITILAAMGVWSVSNVNDAILISMGAILVPLFFGAMSR